MRRLRWLGFFAALSWFLLSNVIFAQRYALRSQLDALANEPHEISSFTARVDGKCLFIRNTGSFALSDGWFRYEVEFDNGQYSGSEDFSWWKSDEEIAILIAPPQAPGRVIVDPENWTAG